MADGEQPNWQANLTSLLREGSWPVELTEIVDKLANNIPLNLEDGKFLFNYNDLDLIGHLASIVKRLDLETRYSSMLMSTLTKQISAPWHANSALSEGVDVPTMLINWKSKNTLKI